MNKLLGFIKIIRAQCSIEILYQNEKLILIEKKDLINVKKGLDKDKK